MRCETEENCLDFPATFYCSSLSLVKNCHVGHITIFLFFLNQQFNKWMVILFLEIVAHQERLGDVV